MSKTIDFKAAAQALRENWAFLLALGLLDEVLSIPVSSMAWTVVSGLIGVVLPAVMLACVFLRIRAKRHGRELPLRAALAQVSRNLGRTTWAFAACLALVLLGIALFVLPAVYFMAKLAFAIPLAVSEEEPWSRTPIQGSDILTRGRMFQLLSLQLGFLILSVAMAIAEGAFNKEISWTRMAMVLPFSLGASLLWICLLAVACDNALTQSKATPAR